MRDMLVVAVAVVALANLAGAAQGSSLCIDLRVFTNISLGVHGQNPYRNGANTPLVFAICSNAAARGPAGGLDADTYDWRDINSGVWFQGPQYTTLDFLRLTRDNMARPLFTVNLFGGGARDASGQFNCRLSSASNAAARAAAWVRYVNVIVRSATQRQLRQLKPADAAIVTSLQWGAKARLRADNEPVTPAVMYWEIGNEPELPQIPGFISNHHVAPEEYCSRYRTITRAMRAVDPTIKTGPCIMYATGPGADYLRGLADDSTTQVDFVSYHPYYYAMKNAWGDVPAMQTALQNFKQYLKGQADAVRQIFQTKNPAVQLIASEWDASSWDATPAQMLSMAEALGLAEGIFSFAEQGLAAANYWEDPVGKPPCHMVFQAIQSHMGSRLLLSAGATPSNQDWRVYATCSPATRQLAVWGLNFNDRTARALHLRLTNYPYRIARVTSMALGVTNAASRLQSNSHIAWRAADITKTFTPAGFTLGIDAATLKVLVIQAAR